MFKEVKLSEDELEALCDRELAFDSAVCNCNFTYYRDVENPDRILAVGDHRMIPCRYIFLFEKKEHYAMKKKAGQDFYNILDRSDCVEKEKEILDIFEKLNYGPYKG